jgi:hypothetical protein
MEEHQLGEIDWEEASEHSFSLSHFWREYFQHALFLPIGDSGSPLLFELSFSCIELTAFELNANNIFLNQMNANIVTKELLSILFPGRFSTGTNKMVWPWSMKLIPESDEASEGTNSNTWIWWS